MDDVRARWWRRLTWWQESLLLLGMALALALVVKALFLQAFYIPSASMEPGLVENDRILVQKMSYWSGTPERGDVVVFADPGGWLRQQSQPGNALTGLLATVGLYPDGGHLVKRVIGVGGDVVECCDEQGRLLVNGHPLDETAYLPDRVLSCHGPMPGTCDSGGWRAGPVPDGQLFVMGDNRDHSEDSTVRLCTRRETDCSRNPYVAADHVVGKVFTRVWPPSRWGGVGRPATFEDIPDPSAEANDHSE